MELPPLLGREAQAVELARAAGLDGDPAAPLVVVFGGVAAGKSASVALALRRRAAAFALVDCAAVFSAQDLFREALAQLRRSAADRALDHREAEEEEQRAADEERERVRVEGEQAEEVLERGAPLSFLAFVRALRVFMARRGAAALHLALDHADRLLARGLAPLLASVLRINEQLAFAHVLDDAPPWRACVLLVTRGVSTALGRLVGPFLPAYICFPPYSPDEVAAILAAQLSRGGDGDGRALRRWTRLLLDLLPPAPQGDWRELRACAADLLPEVRDQLRAIEASPRAGALTHKLATDTRRLVARLLGDRKHKCAGLEALRRPDASLSRTGLLLVLAGFLASFNPQEADAKFLSSAGGPRRKKRRKGAADQAAGGSADAQRASQRLIGPRVFSLQRLLAIYLNLRAEAAGVDASGAREDIFPLLATLVRMQLFQRTSPPTALDDIKFRCLADWTFVLEAARALRFPIEAYLSS